MSLFIRPCLQATTKPTRAVFIASRALSDKHVAPVEVAHKQSEDIIPTPTRDVVTADVISGAPGMPSIPEKYV